MKTGLNQHIGTHIAHLQVLLTLTIFMMIHNPNKQKMLIRLLLVTFFFLSALFDLHGQIQKKSLMVGGEMDIPFQNQIREEKTFYLNSKVGYFIVDNLAIGIIIESELFIEYDHRTFSLGAGPMIRYYVGQNKVKPFGSFSYVASIVTGNFFNPNEFLSHLQPGIGICYQLRPTIGIEALIGYDHYYSNSGHSQNESFCSLHIGFQIFIPPNNSTN
ncbi:MAG: hypothetical protein DRJ29_16230 [Bacteroidetes bacterium]|nr:MAG: hypothetical protein DRJ29_16230 [Bacteroidota bacterium]